MILVPPAINNRNVFYLEIRDSLEEFRRLQLQNWVVYVIEDDKNNPILSEFVEICINKDLLYMYATGKACSEIDDLFDMNLVMREIEKKPMPSWFTSDDDLLMTTWHHDFDEGFWYCTTLTNHDRRSIHLVLVVNLTKANYLPRIKKLTKLISEGWFPED